MEERMILSSRGYELILAEEEAIMLHQLTGNLTKDQMRKAQLTEEEIEMAMALYHMLREHVKS